MAIVLNYDFKKAKIKLTIDDKCILRRELSEQENNIPFFQFIQQKVYDAKYYRRINEK